MTAPSRRQPSIVDLKNALLSSRAMDEYLELRTGQEIIDDIQALFASARKALEPFAEITKELQPQLADDYKNTMHWAVPTVGDLRAAAAALKDIPK